MDEHMLGNNVIYIQYNIRIVDAHYVRQQKKRGTVILVRVFLNNVEGLTARDRVGVANVNTCLVSHASLSFLSV